MRLPKRVIIDYQIITELDKEEAVGEKVKVWSRMGYKPHGPLLQSVATIRPKDKQYYDAIIYTQVMVCYGWRLV